MDDSQHYIEANTENSPEEDSDDDEMLSEWNLSNHILLNYA